MQVEVARLPRLACGLAHRVADLARLHRDETLHARGASPAMHTVVRSTRSAGQASQQNC